MRSTLIFSQVYIVHLDNEEECQEIEEQLSRFLKKIQGKLENVQLVIVYVDKHKTRKYSIRARMVTNRGVTDAKAVGYDHLSACKELVSRLDRRIKSEHSQKVGVDGIQSPLEGYSKSNNDDADEEI